MGERRREYDVDPEMFRKAQSDKPKIPLADIQFYFAKVRERARRIAADVIAAAEQFAKRNPTVKDAEIVSLRSQWFALEEAAALIENRIERHEKAAAARVVAAAREAAALAAASAPKGIE